MQDVKSVIGLASGSTSSFSRTLWRCVPRRQNSKASFSHCATSMQLWPKEGNLEHRCNIYFFMPKAMQFLKCFLPQKVWILSFLVKQNICCTYFDLNKKGWYRGSVFNLTPPHYSKLFFHYLSSNILLNISFLFTSKEIQIHVNIILHKLIYYFSIKDITYIFSYSASSGISIWVRTNWLLMPPTLGTVLLCSSRAGSDIYRQSLL